MCRNQIRKEKFDTVEVPFFLHETGEKLMRIQGPKVFQNIDHIFFDT